MQASGLLRNMRNVVHNYTEVEIKVREATSNDPWGPSSSIMAEIADLTYNTTAFPEIMGMLWKRLSDHGKNWRHVYKSLMLLDYLVKTGSERVSNQCKENIYAIQTLKDFQFTDSRDGKDQGANVRERAKQLVGLLKDDERLRAEREKALKNKERFSKTTTGIGSHSATVQGYGPTGGIADPSRPTQSTGEEELQLQLALAMSKEEADEAVISNDRAKREDEVRMELAIKESLKSDGAPINGAPAAAPVPQKPASAVQDLLNLEMAPSAQPTPSQNNFDPWNTVNAPQAHPPSDPFTAHQQAAPDPFGAPSFGQPVNVAAPDPWGNNSAAGPGSWPNTAAADPWGGPAAQNPAGNTVSPTPPFQHTPDPFTIAEQQNNSSITSDPFGGNMVQKNPVQDPFGAPPSNAPPQKSIDPFASTNITSDPFTSAGLNNNPSATNDLFSLPSSDPTLEHKNPPFDMGLLDGSLPHEEQQSLEQPKKSAQSFLGSASGLVNLDALVTRPKQVAPNPFGPSMNEMARSNQAQQLGLQQPMAPSPVGGMNPMYGQSQVQPTQPQAVFGVPPMTNNWQQPKQQQNIFGGNVGGQQQNQSNNPFL